MFWEVLYEKKQLTFKIKKLILIDCGTGVKLRLQLF